MRHPQLVIVEADEWLARQLAPLADESRWLGWLGIAEAQLEQIDTFGSLAADIKEGAFTHALLLGMGGSSLAPEVLRRTFGVIDGFPELHVLDSTDPAQVKRFEEAVDLKSCLFLVSSKSGSTLEPNIFKAYFYDKAKQAVGEAEAPKRFMAVTDPGSTVEKMSREAGFRRAAVLRAGFFALRAVDFFFIALAIGISPSRVRIISNKKNHEEVRAIC